MATTIYLPKDERFENVGRALGQAVAQNQAEKKRAEEEERRRQAYQDSLDIAKGAIDAPEEEFNAGATYEGLATGLYDAGREDQIDDLMGMVMEARGEAQKRQTQSNYINSLPDSSPLKQRVMGKGGFDTDTVKDLAETEQKFAKDSASAGERKITVFNPEGAQRDAFVPKHIPGGEIDSYIATTYGQEWSTTQPKGEGTPVNAKDIRDVNGILTNRGINPGQAKPEERAGARNIMNNTSETSKFLAQSYGKDVVQDPLGGWTVKSWRGEDDRIKHHYASQQVDDLLFQGMSPADAAAEAEKAAEVSYSTGEWLPPQIKEQGSQTVEDYLASRNIDDPDLVEYVDAERLLKDAQANPGTYPADVLRMAHKKVLVTRNPQTSLKEIEQHLDSIYGGDNAS